MTTRKGRGARTQDVVRNFYREHGWADAEDAPASVSGRDITKMLGLAPEVKARRGFEPLAWLRQAAKARVNADGGLDHHYVVFRCDGQGESDVGAWGVLMDVETHTRLLHEAGYGMPEGGRLAGGIVSSLRRELDGLNLGPLRVRRECGAYFAAGRGAQHVCGRAPGHPTRDEDGIGHADSDDMDVA